MWRIWRNNAEKFSEKLSPQVERTAVRYAGRILRWQRSGADRLGCWFNGRSAKQQKLGLLSVVILVTAWCGYLIYRGMSN